MNTNALVFASLAWWREKAPAQWTDEQHHTQPCVNCKGMSEFNLATAVSNLLKEKKK